MLSEDVISFNRCDRITLKARWLRSGPVLLSLCDLTQLSSFFLHSRFSVFVACDCSSESEQALTSE